MKTIAIYALQVLIGLVALVAGCVMLGMPLMSGPAGSIAAGQGLRLVMGALEIAGGVCLLFPRSGLIGAVLLTSVVISTFGATIGQVAGPRPDGMKFIASQAKQGWDI